MPTEMEMQRLLEERMAELLRHASQSKVAAALGVTRTTVWRWEHGQAVTPGAVSRVQALLRPDLPGIEEEAPRPKWAEGLVTEIRMNRAVIQASLQGVDPERTARIFALLETLVGPPEQAPVLVDQEPSGAT